MSISRYLILLVVLSNFIQACEMPTIGTKSFKISFNANGGTGSMSNQTLATDMSENLKPNRFVRQGFTFVGWNSLPNGSGIAYADSSLFRMGASDVFLFAQWTLSRHTIVFLSNGGSGSMQGQTVAEGGSSRLNPNLFTKAGYHFSGWNTQMDGLGTAFADSSNYQMGFDDVTLYAIWTSNQCTLVFDSQGGTDVSNVSADYGSPFEIPTTPTKQNAVFAGWWTKPNGQGVQFFGTSMPDSQTLYAFWIQKYIITYHLGQATSGFIPQDSRLYLPGDSITISNPTLLRDGWTFGTWNDKEDGTGTNYAPSSYFTMPPKNLDLFVVWVPAYLNVSATMRDLAVTGPNPTHDPYTGYYMPSQDIVVPEGVTRIENNGISRYSEIASISLPNSLVSIGNNAFRGTNISSLDIPAGVTTIGESPCNACSKLVSISVNSSNPYYYSTNGFLVEKSTMTLVQGVSLGGPNLSVPNGIKTIGKSSLACSTTLVSLSIPETTTTINDEAFSSCYELSSVGLPASLSHLGVNVFNGDRKLIAINVSDMNSVFASIVGVLCSKDKTRLIYVPSGLTGPYFVPASIVTIENQAFYSSQVSSIDLGKSLVTIGDFAFAGATNLKSLSIPNSVQSIGKQFIDLDLSLTDVYFASQSPAVLSGTFDTMNMFNLKLHIPPGSLNTYKFTQTWNDLAKYLTEN